MQYLVPSDYNMLIQPQMRAQLNAIALQRAELTAMEEIAGYLNKKYDVTAEFTETALYSTTAEYKGGNRVYKNASTYNAASTYNIGDLAIYSSAIYRCLSDTTTGAFNTNKWYLVANLYSSVTTASVIYYAAYPYSVFDIYGNYAKDDKVFWRNKTHKALQPTATVDSFIALQYRTIDNVPLSNVFPDDPANGSKYWSFLSNYSVSANSLNSADYNPTDTYSIGATVTYMDNNVYICTTAITDGEPFNPDKWALLWVCGDNRSQLMVTHMINIALYWAHYSIAPNNIPDDRRDAYGIAKEWCKSIRDGVNTTNLPVIQPRTSQGTRMLSDYNVKRQNGY